MNKHRIQTTLVAAMVAITMAGSSSAWAERKHDQYGYNSHSQDGRYDKRFNKRERSALNDRRAHKRDHAARYDKRAHKRDHVARHNSRAYGHGGYNDKRYHKKQHKKYDRHHYKYSNKHRGHGGNNYYYKDDDSDENLLFGLLVGGLIGYAINSAQDNDDYYDSYPQSGTVNTPQASVYQADTSRSGTCLQEREYQTRVIVGGRSVDAYGTACLQPDGSWTRGPAKLASY